MHCRTQQGHEQTWRFPRGFGAGYPDPFDIAMSKNNRSWEQFWGSGGDVDLSESKDPRWKELERRVVLFQYLTAIQSRQQYPPQETGLTHSARWYGKFHLEMHRGFRMTVRGL